jgi:hypothetical protein
VPTTTIQAAPPEEGTVRVFEQQFAQARAVMTADVYPLDWDGDAAIVRIDVHTDLAPAHMAVPLAWLEAMVRSARATQVGSEREVRRRSDTRPAHEALEPVGAEAGS